MGSSSLKSHHLISLSCMYLSQTFTSQFAASPERRGRRNTREERANHSRLALWAPNHSLTVSSERMRAPQDELALSRRFRSAPAIYAKSSGQANSIFTNVQDGHRHRPLVPSPWHTKHHLSQCQGCIACCLSFNYSAKSKQLWEMKFGRLDHLRHLEPRLRCLEWVVQGPIRCRFQKVTTRADRRQISKAGSI